MGPENVGASPTQIYVVDCRDAIGTADLVVARHIRIRGKACQSVRAGRRDHGDGVGVQIDHIDGCIYIVRE